MARTKIADTKAAPIRVAEYVRMSSEHQQYSTLNQSCAIDAYATAHLMSVVTSYRDEGRSGLRLDGRHALQKLLADVRAGDCGFEAVLVFDVSRWGRFQNGDEAAYYEFVCHLGGVRVVYVNEPFSNDGSPLSSVLKGLKRAMAAEYSRELSAKVFTGQCRLINMGYRQGGSAGYGLRRMRVDAQGHHLGILERGQHKAHITDRVILVPGPASEVAVVHGMYRDFLAGVGEAKIATGLNARGIPNAEGKAWRRHHVYMVLSNEKYVGDNIFGRTTSKLRQHRNATPEHQWIRRNASFEPIVSPRTFAKAKERFRLRGKPLTDEEALQPLRRILLREGRLSTLLIQKEPDALSIPALVRRFGGLRQIYARLGFIADKNLDYADVRFRLRDLRAELMAQVTGSLVSDGAMVVTEGMQLRVDDAWTVSVTVVQASFYRDRIRWYIRQRPENSDIVVFARMSGDGTAIEDFVVAPRLIIGAHPKDLSPKGFPDVAAYTFPSLSVLAQLGHPDRVISTASVAGEDNGDDASEALAGTVQACRRHMSGVRGAFAALQAFPGQLPVAWQRFQGPEDCHLPDSSTPHGETVLRMVVLRGRVASLLAHAPLVGWVARHHPAALAVFQAAAELEGIQGKLFHG
jgi:DNA invertase Pin-like site-specific DNA recombinase